MKLEQQGVLWAPISYWELDPKDRVGGCGPGKFGDKLVPDTIYLLDVVKACKIHDFMYAIGEGMGDKFLADNIFKDNMFALIDEGAWVFRFPRKVRANTYYVMVSEFGLDSYLRAGTNKKLPTG